MKQLLALLMLILPAGVCVAQPGTTQTPTPTPTPSATRSLSWWDKALIVLGVAATPRNQKGEETKQTGNIFVVKLDADLEPAGRRMLRVGGGYRSPVLLPGGEKLLAIKGDKIVMVSFGVDEKVTDVTTIKGIIKLVGVSGDNANEVLILADVDGDNCPGVGMLSLSSKEVTPLAHGWDEQDAARLNELKGWDRQYSGGDTRLLEIREEVTEGTGETKRKFNLVNVYLKPKARGRINISECTKVDCVQPTFTADARLVAYIKVE